MKPLPIADLTTCKGCGACCREQESPPGYVMYLVGLDGIDPDDEDAIRIRAMPAKLRRDLLSYIEDMRSGRPHPRGGVCLWFDERTRKCRHYEWGPSICRDAVEVGDESCLEWRFLYSDTLKHA